MFFIFLLFFECTFCRIRFVYILSRSLLEARLYPVATMVGQSLGSLLVGVECLLRCCPHYYIDTTGAPFTYPMAKYLAGCDEVLAYVHYPIISQDMLERVRSQRPSYNNNQAISGSVSVSSLKLLYYRAFSWCFCWAGQTAGWVMVNGSWTCGHISSMWRLRESRPGSGFISDSNNDNSSNNNSRRLVKVYPPCNTSHLQAIQLARPGEGSVPATANRSRYVLSVGQFRPEKDHSLQLRAFKELRVRPYRSNPNLFLPRRIKHKSNLRSRGVSIGI